jgi:hypothetical protein
MHVHSAAKAFERGHELFATFTLVHASSLRSLYSVAHCYMGVYTGRQFRQWRLLRTHRDGEQPKNPDIQWCGQACIVAAKVCKEHGLSMAMSKQKE